MKRNQWAVMPRQIIASVFGVIGLDVAIVSLTASRMDNQKERNGAVLRRLFPTSVWRNLKKQALTNWPRINLG